MAKTNTEIKARYAMKVSADHKKIWSSFERLLLGSILPITLIITWEIVSQLGWVESYQLPAPTAILARLTELASSGELTQHIYITVYRVFAGFLLGTAIAVIFALLVGFLKKAEYVFDPIIQAFRSIPSPSMGTIIYPLDGYWGIFKNYYDCSWCFLSSLFKFS